MYTYLSDLRFEILVLLFILLKHLTKLAIFASCFDFMVVISIISRSNIWKVMNGKEMNWYSAHTNTTIPGI